jgi:hypothetical protein
MNCVLRRSFFGLKCVDDVLSSLYSTFVCRLGPLAESSLYVLAVGEEGVVEALGHEEIAAEDAAERRSLDLVDAVDEVVLALILSHRQLEFAHCFLDPDLQYHVSRLRLRKSVVQLQNLVSTQVAQLVTGLHGLRQVFDGVEHDFATEEVADGASCLNLLLSSLHEDFCDLFGPHLHDLVDHIKQSDGVAVVAQFCVDLADDGLDALFVDLLLEHLL